MGKKRKYDEINLIGHGPHIVSKIATVRSLVAEVPVEFPASLYKNRKHRAGLHKE